MGFLSKIWKGIKKTVKKIFKPIKKVFKSVGKFMGKIGIVGQIAMSFILPGIGSALAGTFSNVVGGLMGGALGSVGKAAGWVLGKAGEFAKMAYKGYKTVTGAITDFVGTTGKYVGGKLGLGENMSLSQAFGKEGWGGRLTDSFSKLGDAAGEFFDTDVKGVLPKPEINLGASLNAEKSKFVPEDMLGEKTDFSLEEMLKGNQLSPEEAKKLGYIDLRSVPKVTDDLPSFTEMLKTKPTSSDIKDLDVFQGVPEQQSLLSKGLEKLTGETTLAGAGTKAAGRFGEYLLDAPGKAVASTLTTGLGQAVGVIGKPPGDPGPAWGSQYYQQTVSQPTMAFQQATAEMPMPSYYENYVASSPLMGVSQGSWLGPDFWQRELQSRVAA